MDKTLKGIVIKSKDYGEADKLITLLTFEEGRVVVKARSVKKARAKLKFATEPFCFGEFEISNSKGIPILTGCEMIELFYDLRSNIEKYYIASALLEFIDNVTSEQQDCSQEVLFLARALEQIANYTGEIQPLAVKTIYQALESSGYGFSNFTCAVCGCKIENNDYFNAEMGQFFCEGCHAENVELKIKMFKGLELIVETPIDKLPEIKINNDDYKLILKFLWRYIQYKFDFSNLSLNQYIKML
ncbi:MAG: DNA repair protein RecO [Clostridia bacterium]